MKNKLPRFRDLLTFSVFLFVLPAKRQITSSFLPLLCRPRGSLMLSLRKDRIRHAEMIPFRPIRV